MIAHLVECILYYVLFSIGVGSTGPRGHAPFNQKPKITTYKIGHESELQVEENEELQQTTVQKLHLRRDVLGTRLNVRQP